MASITVTTSKIQDVALAFLATARGLTTTQIVNSYFEKALVEDLKRNQLTFTEDQKKSVVPLLK